MNKALALNPPFTLRRLSFYCSTYLKVFWVLSFITILILLLFYIFQVNTEVSERYLIQKYERRLAELSVESKNLEISSSQFNSLDNIILSLENLNFEKANKIDYIRILNNQVVAK